MPRKSKQYINNKQFTEILTRFFENKNKEDYEKLGTIFIKISENILKRPNFINYTHDRKNDMVSDATFYMVKYCRGYDVTRGNPFAYFSQIAFNAFKQNINKVNKQKLIFVPLDYIENLSDDIKIEIL